MPSTVVQEAMPPSAGTGFVARIAALVRARWPQVAVFLLVLSAVDIVRSYAIHPFSFAEFFSDRIVLATFAMAAGAGGCGIAGTFAAAALPLGATMRAIAMLALSVLGVALANGAIWLLDPGMLMPATQRDAGVTPTAFILRNLWYYAAAALLLAAYFATRERDAAITRAAQAAELERGNVQRAVMQSRLEVMQARVEPELLFDVLADVQRLYASAPQEAEALLEDLIGYLRAALPQMRGGASTLAREAALALAYLRVTAAGRGGALGCDQRIPPDLADLPFPPMVLLPLVHAAAEAGVSSLAIEAHARAAAVPKRVAVDVILRVAPGGRVPGWANEKLTVVHAIARGYFGADTALDLDENGPAATLRFTLPQALFPALAPSVLPQAAGRA